MQTRIYHIMVLCLLVFSTLLGRLFCYQIVNGEDIAREAVNMRCTQVQLREYARGDIVDRNFLPITGQSSSWAVYALPQVFSKSRLNVQESGTPLPKLDKIAAQISAVLAPMDTSKLIQQVKQAQTAGLSIVKVAYRITEKQRSALSQLDLPGIVAAPVSNRYREDGFLVHLLGYVRNDAQARGQTGIEAMYDQILRNPGAAQTLSYMKDARGETIKGLMFRLQSPEQKSSMVVTTIDRRIQQIVEESMNRSVKKGAVVVMDVHSKEILAMASRPSFNPYQVESAMQNKEDTPLINRAIEGFYPGSLFKMMVSTAALGEKTVSWKEPFDCSGAYHFDDGFSISCWKKEGHGRLQFHEAFANSCNSAFIQIGLKLGRERLMKQVGQVHLTDEQIIGYPLAPSNRTIRIDGGERALANACLGQQGVLLSPVQIASLVSTIADDGRWSPPVLVSQTIDREGNIKSISRPAKQQVIKVETSRTLQSLLAEVVENGTGKTAAISESTVAGKTATSQTGRMDGQGKEILNTWFAGYFPADHPKWAIVVLAEEGASGAESAAPVFREICEGMLAYHQVPGT